LANEEEKIAADRKAKASVAPARPYVPSDALRKQAAKYMAGHPVPDRARADEAAKMLIAHFDKDEDLKALLDHIAAGGMGFVRIAVENEMRLRAKASRRQARS
jgi:predicted lipid-binding transport protein (Tim44 family)